MEARIALPSCVETPICFLAPYKSQAPSEPGDCLDRGRQENQPFAVYTPVYRPLGHEVSRSAEAPVLVETRVFRALPLLRTTPEVQWLFGFRRFPFFLFVQQHPDKIPPRHWRAL